MILAGMETELRQPAFKRYRSTFYGAVAGGLLALLLTAVFGGMTALGSVDATVLDPATGRSRPEFVVTNGAMYFLVIVMALIGGGVVAAVTYAFGRQSEPTSPKLPLRYLLPAGAITAAVFTYAVLRAGLGAAGDITAGVVTISVFRLLIVAVIAGAVAGGVTAGAVAALARPDFLSVEGEAVPASAQAFAREMVRAVSGPMIGTLIAAGFAVGLSQILLAIEGVGAVAIFSVVGAIVLGGATLLALRPWERNGPGGASS
jgi:hypothetical protein